MKSLSKICALLLLVCAFLLTGCDPEKTRIIWSPDGKQAIVILNDGLHLSDPAGKLSPLLIPEVKYAEWFADSQRVLILRNQWISSWKDLDELISDSSRKEIIALAPKLRAEAMAYEGDWDKFFDTLNEKFDKKLLEKYGRAVAIYLRDKKDFALLQKIGDRWKDFAQLNVASTVVQSCDLTPAGPKPGPILLQCAVDTWVSQIRISPTGKNAAVSYSTFEDASEHLGSDQSLRLALISLVTTESFHPIADTTARFVDWTPDGRYLVFGRTDAADPKNDEEHHARLGSISRYEVFEPGDAPPGGAKAQDLVGILYNPFTRVRCLKDGRILFSSPELQIPATPPNMPESQSLFALDPARQSTVTNLIPRNVLPNTGGLVDYFEVSPDEKRVSLLDPQGRVRVLTLATGDVKTLQDKIVPGLGDDVKAKPRIVPTWRTAEELTFAELIENPAPGTPEARFTLTNVISSVSKSLSDTWPRAATEGIFVPIPQSREPVPATQK